MELLSDDEPIYVISVAARLVDMHPQTLRYYERAGLLKPTRSSGKIRLYSAREIERLKKISRLTNELGVNLAGVQIIIDLTERMEKLQEHLKQRETTLQNEIHHLEVDLETLRQNCDGGENARRDSSERSP
ncbi:MAG: helix-turn-helix transcriptional regulator [Chloroflexi bacterium]|nr:helix-turn-helix transcriptional regulator [Chloroflexota bacterium]